MTAGDGESVFSFGKPCWDTDKMFPRYIGGDYSDLDELDDDVFHPDDFIFPGQSGNMSPASFFTQAQSYTCFRGRFQLFPLSHCCGPGIKFTEHQDKATQTQNPSSPSDDIMLPCGVTEEPQRLFYGANISEVALIAEESWYNKSVFSSLSMASN
ncbi:bcl-2-modifying factor isoform X2 [Ambystoma mexicanum]|uniref:bcl-2-modifying factor isoform X2 n=1 Tax=Ambystoma mexicanum TaxID=8296 RepID=UPI0037E8CB97